MSRQLPNGTTERPATQEDANIVCELWNARSYWARSTQPYNAAAVRKCWDDPRFNLKTDSLLVFDPNSNLVGYAHIRDVKDAPLDVFCGYSVHPKYDEQTWLWKTLLEWIDAEARCVIPEAPADARIALIAGASDDDLSEQKRLEEFGFEHSRIFHRMTIEFEKPVPSSAMPAGIAIRSFVQGEDNEALVHAYRDAFRDHYGHLE